MKLKSIELTKFKRFTHATITELPESAKLIILIGSNGSGKTSVLEALKQWSSRYGSTNFNSDASYLGKENNNFNNTWNKDIKVNFHGITPSETQAYKKAFYFRSAYRNEADFTISGLQKVGSALDATRISRLIDNDASVSDNYQRIVSQSVEKLYSGEFDANNAKELREALIGEIRESMKRIFGDLILTGPGDPLKDGAFYFKKGTVENFHFKNLSGGEKSAFDLILDIITKRNEFNDTIYCIDEPDTHLHSKLQGKVLKELYDLIPDNSQLVLSTHSIGMMRTAVQMQKDNPDKVVFLDFHDKNPDEEIILTPVKVSRDLWKQTLAMALDDLSELISPKQIVICEGRPRNLNGKNLEFDAKCLRNIFNPYLPEVDFISIGSEKDVTSERIDIVSTLQLLNKGIEFIKIIDKDDRSETEISDLLADNIKVLQKRDIENYLLDDEIISKLCLSVSQEEKIEACLKIKADAIKNSIEKRQNPEDDIKSASGEIYVNLKKELLLTQCGNNVFSFLRDTIAPLITEDTEVYKKLKKEIFE
ncbi:AAA family ATPase [Candidatus Kapabacteria bacterium]|nr:AAA family ATPase [Candidatus Kapabacteria bacterium]